MLLGGTHSFDMLDFVNKEGSIEPLCVAEAMDKITEVALGTERMKANPLMLLAPAYFAEK